MRRLPYEYEDAALEEEAELSYTEQQYLAWAADQQQRMEGAIG